MSALVARALGRLLSEPALPRRAMSAFKLVVVGGPGPTRGLDLDRTSELLVAEDEIVYGRPRRRK